MTNTHPELKLLITPRRPALVGGAANIVEVLVRLQAPERPANQATRKRPDINLALVIDRSGSMRGRPLDEACNAARFVVGQLGGQDRCAIVVYDHIADVLMPATPVEHREAFNAAIAQIRVGGNTDLHQGWLRGAETLAPLASASTISRVILLSDGNANAGLRDQTAICTQVNRLAEAGVTTTTLGLGQSFNEVLMTEIANAGGGRAYYGEDAEDLMSPIREELDLLNDIAARRIGCLFKPAEGITVEVINRIGNDEHGRHRMPDVAWNSEAVIALRLTVPAHLLANETLCELISASASFLDADGNTHAIASEPLILTVMEPAAYAALAEDDTVATRFTELRAAAIQDRAREAAAEHDWAAVERCLDELIPLARDNPWIEGILKHTRDLTRRRERDLLMKETRFSSDRMKTRLAELNEKRGLDGENTKAAHLARNIRHGKGRPQD